MPDRHDAPRFRPGLVFKDGKAYDFQPRSLTVIRPWPAPAAWRLEGDATVFRHVLPDFHVTSFRRQARAGFADATVRSILADYPDRADDAPRLLAGFTARRDAARALLDAIPADVRRVVGRYPQAQWAMLTFLGRVPGGLELATSNPALAWALARNPSFHRPRVRQPLRAARTWVNKPRRAIAGWLGFPATNSIVRLLAKVDARDVDALGLFGLRSLARRDAPELAALRHLPRLTRPVLEATGRISLRRFATSRLLTELATASRPVATESLALLRDIARMRGAIRDPAHHGPASVPSIEQLGRVHDAWVDRTNAFATKTTYRFPPPPIPGTDAIEPITDAADLRREGREMHHCVGSYAAWVAAGRGFVYRVRHPERATFSLERTPGGGWRIAELRTSANAPVRPETLAAVRTWFERKPAPHDPTPPFPEFLEAG